MTGFWETIKGQTSKLILVFIFTIGVVILPGLVVQVRFSKQMFSNINDLPHQEYGVVFGARVYGENRLTDAAKERADAAVLLYQKGKIDKVFVSGDNANDQEAENLAKHLITNGVPQEVITVDTLGVDTHQTCIHLHDNHITSATLITQGFHLPRAMMFCNNEVESLIGIRANDLGVLQNRGENQVQIYYIRTLRFFRESLLTWSYILGVYDLYASKTEIIPSS